MKLGLLAFNVLIGLSLDTASATNSTSSNSPTHNVTYNTTSKPVATSGPTTSRSPVITSSPTDSPAPSPQPSAEPSPAPTGTFAPSRLESDSPTDSPAPSPAPSMSPSVSSEPSKSPSVAPSKQPSQSPSRSISPTTNPTLSISPSRRPSLSPSSSPSFNPSQIPSDLPSISSSPSSTPTTGAPSSTPSTGAPSFIPSDIPSDSPSIHSTVLSAVIGVTIHLHDVLNNDQAEIFEAQAIDFIESQWSTDMPLTEGMTIDILNLTITEQTVIPERRELMGHRRLHAAGLRIRFNVIGEVKPGDLPKGFIFADQISRPFRENYALFIYQLQSANQVFASLVDSSQSNPNAAPTDSEQVSDGRPSSGAIAGIVIASVGSVFLAIAAAVYAIKARRNDGITHSPILNLFQIERCDSHSTAMTPVNAPNSGDIEQLGAGEGPVQSKDSLKSLLDAVILRNESEGDSEDSRSDLGLQLSADVLGAHALKRDQLGNTGNSRGSDPPTNKSVDPLGARPNVATIGVGSLCYSDDDSTTSVGTPKSVELTPSAVQTPSSVFSGLAHLGARPMESSEQLHFQQETRSVGSSTFLVPPVKRTGLYDVFAPSGPLGIVVDTTRDGPIVHSMKPTSPLLGLVSPGDLIVGLDDMDTRSMTAATLTRFMAKRSHQAERKITLLAFEGGSGGSVMTASMG